MYYDVCVFGGCSLDNMFYQEVSGGYPGEANLTVFGGKGANQAIAAARAGAKTTIITRIGKDEVGKKIIDNFKINNVDVSNIEELENVVNDYSNIFININDKDNEIERYGNAINSFSKEMILKNKETILNSTIVVAQLKCPLEVTEELINFCYDNEKILILTPCRPERLIGREDLIDKVSMITCNRKECEIMLENSNIEECVKKYPNKLIVTLGAEGLMYYDGKRVIKMPAIDVNVEDTTGAGDTLNGNLAYLLSQGLDLKHSLRKAMYASALKIQTKTAQKGMPYKEELEKYIMECRNKKFEYNSEFDLAIDLVRRAYFLIKSRADFAIKTKSDNTLVTTADTQIESYLINEIQKRYENDNFLSEETHSKTTLKDRTWIIDPIDGTSHFVNGSDFWGIQLAFFDKGETRFSIIYLPKMKKMYYALKNQGAYVNNNKILLDNLNTKDANRCIVEFGGSIYKQRVEKLNYLIKLIGDNMLLVSNVMHINSSCVAYTNLVTGNTDALVTSTKKLWDIMPGEFLLKETGIKAYKMDFENKLTLFTNNEQVRKLLLENKKDKRI